MVKLIVVAGSGSQKLADFFANRGTFEIVAVYDNLSNNVNQIQNKVIVSDKLLYLYNDSEDASMNIKSDMQVLGNLLKNDSFFKPGEIVFMTTASQQAKLATTFFVTIMEDSNKSDYSIKTVEDKMSFVAIYNLLMGTTNSSDFKNTYTTLYKVERNTIAEEEFPPQDDRDLLIEPFGLDSVVGYREKQQAAKKADTGTVYVDNADTTLEKNNTVQFDTMKLHHIADKTSYIFVSGLTKSGKSVWASQLAVSAYKCDASVCLFDFSRNRDVINFIEKSSVQVSEYSMIHVLRKQAKEHELAYVAPASDAEASVLPEFMQLFFNQKEAFFDVLIIACELSDFNRMRRLCINDADMIAVSNAIMSDISTTCESLPLYDKHTRSTLILNRIVSLDDSDYVTAEDARSMLPKSLRIVKDKQFTTFDSKGQLFSALFGD